MPKQNQNKQSQQKPLESRQSPNLLSPSSTSSLSQNIEKHHLTVSAVAKISIILVQTIFVILLGINTTTVSDVTQIENEVKALETQLISKAATVTRIGQIIEKTERLKVLEDTRPELSEKIRKAIEVIPPQIILTQASIKPETMEIVIETETPLDAALLINLYFNQDLASEVTLNSATLSTTTGKFITNMEVRFK